MALMHGGSIGYVALRAALALGLLLLLAQFGRRTRWRTAALGAAYLMVLGYGVWELSIAYDGAHNARIAGHEIIAVASLLSMYGCATLLLLPRLEHPWALTSGRVLLLLGLTALLFGGLMGNARWATTPYRILGYTAVFGGIWLAEGVLERRIAKSVRVGSLRAAAGEEVPGGVQAPVVRRTVAEPADDRLDDVQGMLSLVAVLAGALIVVPFEVERVMEWLFDLNRAHLSTATLAPWHLGTEIYVTAAGWLVYGLVAAVAGLMVRSYRTWLFGGGICGMAVLYLLVYGFGRTHVHTELRVGVWVLVLGGLLLLGSLWWWGRPAHKTQSGAGR